MLLVYRTEKQNKNTKQSIITRKTLMKGEEKMIKTTTMKNNNHTIKTEEKQMLRPLVFKMGGSCLLGTIKINNNNK